MDNSKSEDAEDVIVIPEQIQDILNQLRKSSSCNAIKNSTQNLFIIDNFSISKYGKDKDLEGYKWIEDLLQDEPFENQHHKNSFPENLFSNGPILLTEGDYARVSTPQKEQYYKVNAIS